MVTRLHPAFTSALVLTSLEHLEDDLDTSVQALRVAKLESADKDAAAFCADRTALITSTLTIAVFCEEGQIVDRLGDKAIVVLTAEYRNIFRRAGFG